MAVQRVWVCTPSKKRSLQQERGDGEENACWWTAACVGGLGRERERLLSCAPSFLSSFSGSCVPPPPPSPYSSPNHLLSLFLSLLYAAFAAGCPSFFFSVIPIQTCKADNTGQLSISL